MAIARLLSLELAQEDKKRDFNENKELHVPRLIYSPDSDVLILEDGSKYFRLGPCISHGAYGKVFMLFEGDISKERKLSPFVLKLEIQAYQNKITNKIISKRKFKLLDESARKDYEIIFPEGKELKAEALITSKFVGQTAYLGNEEKMDEPHGILMPKCYGDTLTRFEFCNTLQYLSILIKLAICVKKLHEQGLAHTDLHTSNILVTPQGEVNIIDYGKVLIMQKNLKQKHFDKKKFSYLAPERLEGDIPVNSGLDVYSLGDILQSTYAKYNFNLALKDKFLKLIAKTKAIPNRRIDVRQLQRELTQIYYAEYLFKNQDKLAKKYIPQRIKESIEKFGSYLDDTDSFFELYNKIQFKFKLSFIKMFGMQRIYALTSKLNVADKHKFIMQIMGPLSWFEQYKFKNAYEMEVAKREKKPGFFEKAYEISELYEDNPSPPRVFLENRT